VGCGVGDGWGNVFTGIRGGCCACAGACTGTGVGVARGAGETEGSLGGSKVAGGG